ncbi:hypothetical protein FJTKL_01284 [Diaporthe vaccinii]|uniref:Uncharacterized protein n=1 Tax=Diaporthe vaccinii TaxID=105482 RepID=A0ABR4E1G2_9PEZI
MWGKRNTALSAVRDCVFVLWDTDFKRGWLVGGDTVALHLLRVHLKTDEDSNEFDFSSLKLLGDDGRSAYSVLEKFNDRKESLNHLKDMEDKPENFDNKQPAENREEAIKRVVGGKLDGIYAVLLQLSTDAQTINKHGGLSGPVLKWYEKKVGTTLRGWDFNQLAGLRKAQIYVYKMDKDPGWLPLARELDVAFLFANGLGPILEPRAGSCCPYFPTLPAGKNFLASGTELLGRFIKRYGGDEESNPPDKTVARLSRSQGWERRLDPFARPNCQGDHLNALGPSCFPVQGTHYAPYDKDREKRWDKEPKLIKGKNLYTKGEIQVMLGNNAKGIVVFGRQLGSEELKDMCRQQSTLRKSGTQPTVNAAPAAAQPSSRPSSRGATPGSNRPTASAADPKLPMKAGTSSRSNKSAPDAKGRAPSVASIGSTDSSRQRKPSGADSGVERPQASTPQAFPASAQRTASVSSVRSTASNPHLRVPSTPIGAGQPGTSSPQSLANSARTTASIVSLRSTGSDTRPRATIPSSGRLGEFTTEPNTPTAARKPSNSSMRTTSSLDSRATGGSNLQIPAAQPPTPALKKSTTDSSDRTTSSRTSKSTQSSAAGSTSANSNQRQQRLGQLGAATAATAITDGHHSTSSGPAPTAGGGKDG